MNERKRYLRLREIKKHHARLREREIPSLAIFNLDLIGRKVSVDGYFEHAELQCVEEYVLPKLCQRDICLDIGANIGNHSVFFAPFFEEVIAFEPNPRTAKVLEANAMLRANITPVNIGLSDRTAVLTASFSTQNVGAASISTRTDDDNSVEFRVDRLDNLLPADQQTRVSMIKIDVESHEPEALRGARGVLDASSPVILMEALKTDIVNGTTEAKKLLVEYGYTHFYEIAPKTPFPNINPTLLKAINSLAVFVTGSKLFGKLEAKAVAGDLPKHGCKLLVASKETIPFQR